MRFFSAGSTLCIVSRSVNIRPCMQIEHLFTFLIKACSGYKNKSPTRFYMQSLKFRFKVERITKPFTSPLAQMTDMLDPNYFISRMH